MKNWFSRISTTQWIFIGMFLGVLIGFLMPSLALELKFVSQIFLRLVKSIVAPLIFATVVLGIAHHSQLSDIGRLGLKSIIYFEVVTTIALFIGLAAINFTQAGSGITLKTVKVETQNIAKSKSFKEHLVDSFPENIAKSIYEGNMLQIVIFSILFGIALAIAPTHAKDPMMKFCESLAETMFKMTELIMKFAPIAVGCAIAYAIGDMGFDILRHLMLLVATLYAALFILILFVFVPIALYFRIPIIPLAKAISEPVSIAFATTSSDSALPKLIKALENFGCSRKIVSFVLPMGYSFNLDGTTLYLSLATIFIAQAANIDLSFGHQLTIMLTLMLTSKGVAGVPRASLVILMGTATSFGLPLEPIFLIFGVDELMDMARTSTNVIGNSLATCVIAKSEGEFNINQ